MSRRSARLFEAAGFLVLLVAYALSFVADVRGRDALTWMDPNQYLGFAADLLTGHRPVASFEVPSLFPFFVSVPLALHPTIAGALSVNLAAAVVLMLAVWALCRQAGIRWPPLVAACALSSPLLVGLSRELYSEFTLSALVALQFTLWFRSERFTRPMETAAFAVLFAIGCMTKMTYPIYFLGPLLVDGWLLLRQKDFRGAGRCVLAVVAPALAALPIQRFLFPAGFAYYLSIGNTLIPAMPLIGPGGRFSAEALAYYPAQVWKSLLFLLTPLLVVPLWTAFRPRPDDLPRRHLVLLAWLLVPLLVLTLEPVKEPRHIAPCAVPAVLLIFAGITRLRRAAVRGALYAVATGLALFQYSQVMYHRVEAPYYTDRPARASDLLDAMIAADPQRPRFEDQPGVANQLRWTYGRNIALTGFDPNRALLYAWQFNPAVTYDLDLLDRVPDRNGWETPPGFQDLFLLTAFSLYNERCGSPRRYWTLDRATVVENADFILAARGSAAELAAEFPSHLPVTAVNVGPETIHVLRAVSMPRPAYRALYAREYLEANTPADDELAAVYYELRMNALLRKDSTELAEIEKDIGPRVKPDVPRRNIYWTGNYRRLQEMIGLAP